MRTYINLVKMLFEDSGVESSHEARMQRAKEQGFNVDDPHYHGTPGGDFDEFDPERTADENLAYGKGIYATRDPEAASGYAQPGSSWGNDTDEEPTPNVHKVFLKVKNPFDLDKIYPFPEVKRIFTHCFTESELENIDLWQEVAKEAYPDTEHYYNQRQELEEKLWNLESADTYDGIDPDDYDDGEDDEEYISDVKRFIESDKKSIQKKLEFIDRQEKQYIESHEKMLASGRTASASGRDIYKTLWQNTGGYYDWRQESRLFGGETDTIEFKTEANQWLEELGYDGLRHTDYYNPGVQGKRKAHSVTIAFHPNQVRSVHANFHPDKVDSPKLSETNRTQR